MGAFQCWETGAGRIPLDWRKSAIAICWVAEKDSVPEPACLKLPSDENTARKSVITPCCLVTSKGAFTVIETGKTFAKL